MTRPTLLILAAGMGSRFGIGIKQLEPVGPDQELIMDYSVHDAIEAGFGKIIFIIRKDIEADFRERIGDRIAKNCESCGVAVEYLFQDPADCALRIPAGRTKPWGTGQAVLSARHTIREPFAVINADDYYGKDAYRQLSNWLAQPQPENRFCLIGFPLKNTLSENGAVNRGLCTVHPESMMLTNIVETKGICLTEKGIQVGDTLLDPDTCVSMNMWGFPCESGKVPEVFGLLESNFRIFQNELTPETECTAEYLLPKFVGRLLAKDGCSVEVLHTSSAWFGMTYREDLGSAQAAIGEMIADGTYQRELFDDLKV